MAKKANPFSSNKREYEGNSEIILNYKNSSLWFSGKNILFEGHRGSGKTSILSAFNYEYVWRVNPLIKYKDELSDIFNSPKFVGVIYKSEKQDTEGWRVWAEVNNERHGQLLFTTYLNYYFADQLFEALEYLIENKYVNNDINEYLLIREIIDKTFLDTHKPYIIDYSIYSLKMIFRNIHKSIRRSINFNICFEDIAKNVSLQENCQLIVDICKSLKKYISSFDTMLFFPLIDDINHLELWQLKCVNSMILNAEHPISFKISCVYGLYETKQSIDGRVIGNSDLTKIFLGLDEDPTKTSNSIETRSLLEDIFNNRIKRVYHNASCISLNSLFGEDADLNNLLINALKTSEKRAVVKLLKEYEKDNRYNYFTDYWLDLNEIKYNITKSETKLDKRKKDSSFYKKYRQTSVFTILNEYNIEKSFLYSGLNIIEHLICGSIRNFLRICEYLWDDVEDKIINNLDNEKHLMIDESAQNRAIRNTAKQVYLGIDNRTLKEGSDTTCQNICNRLSFLFKKFISTDSLRITTECLSLKINKKSVSEELNSILESVILFDAFIKVEKNDYYLIGLHPILSPYFSLPYRSPFYYSETINYMDLNSLLISDEKKAKMVIEKLYQNRISRKNNSHNQLKIFSDEN